MQPNQQVSHDSYFFVLLRSTPTLFNWKNPSKMSSLKDSRVKKSCSKSSKTRSLLHRRRYFIFCFTNYLFLCFLFGFLYLLTSSLLRFLGSKKTSFFFNQSDSKSLFLFIFVWSFFFKKFKRSLLKFMWSLGYRLYTLYFSPITSYK